MDEMKLWLKLDLDFLILIINLFNVGSFEMDDAVR